MDRIRFWTSKDEVLRKIKNAIGITFASAMTAGLVNIVPSHQNALTLRFWSVFYLTEQKVIFSVKMEQNVIHMTGFSTTATVLELGIMARNANYQAWFSYQVKLDCRHFLSGLWILGIFKVRKKIAIRILVWMENVISTRIKWMTPFVTVVLVTTELLVKLLFAIPTRKSSKNIIMLKISFTSKMF